MALERDKQKQVQAAERLIKQGKVREAVARLDRMAFTTPGDLLSLNRMADQLARLSHGAEAVKYYFKIAEEFGRTGFYPKAAAIHKKILRLDADNVDSLVQLGDLYLQQRLPGEAKKYLLHAAQLCLKAQDFALARSVYEKLIEAEPGDPRHRARLAETRAAEGDTEQAGEELILLADSLFSQGKPGDAEKAYLRAAELLPDRPEPVLGQCKSAREQGREQEALELLEKKTAGDSAPPALVGELAVQYQLGGREDEAVELLKRPGAEEIPPETLLRLFRHPLDSGKIEPFWDRMDTVFEHWVSGGGAHRVEAILGRLGTLEKQGHIPALQRLHTRTEAAGDRRASVRALEELIRAYQARSMADEAAPLLEQLEKIAPESALIGGAGKSAPAPKPAEPAQDQTQEETKPESADSPVPQGDLPVEAEAPAVPLNRGDEEFVAGRLTQAEILEKYGLFDQATAQVREVTEKFPGHVPAQERLIGLLRVGGGPTAQRDALIGLALAQRAAGKAADAAKAAAEAEEIEPLDGERRRQMVRLGILEEPSATKPEPAAEAKPAAAPKPAAKPAPAAEAKPAPKPAPHRVRARKTEDDAVVIDFDNLDEEVQVPAVEVKPPAAPVTPEAPPASEAPVAAAPEAPTAGAAKRVRAPGADMIEEIRLLVQEGMADEARRRVDTLRTLGYASEELDDLEARVNGEQAEPPVPAESPAVEEDSLASVLADIDDNDDLSAITAALESEIFAEDVEAPVPEAQSEQSLEDVFAAFKQHVSEEVGSEDFRTHYDLGIAYKEMGLMEEAIGEFALAVKAPEMIREASIMLAMCHRDQGEIEQSAEWYRRAIAAPGGDAESVSGLRYDLAEMLLESGDSAGALEAFRDVLEADPSFRDVADRVEQIKSRSTST